MNISGIKICLSPDCELAASTEEYFYDQRMFNTSEGIIRLWDLRTYKEIRNLYGEDNVIHSIGFTPDRNYLVASLTKGMIKVVDLVNVMNVRTLLQPEIIKADIGDNNILTTSISPEMLLFERMIARVLK